MRFIINPAACGKNGVRKITDAVREVLSSENGVFEIRAAKSRGEAGVLSVEAVGRGYEAVIACGGDGTVNEVAAPIVGSPAVLGVIPMGSGNGFARSLGLPFDIKEAVRLIKGWKVREVDAGVICGRYFFATAGCGFDACLSRIYNQGRLSGRLRGILPYFPAALFHFFRYRAAPVTVTTASGGAVVTPFIMTVANTREYGGGAVIAPGADPEDGLLDLCIIPEVNIIRASVLAWRLFSGKIDNFKGFTRILTPEARIKGTGISTLHADGEPFECAGEIKVSVVPKGLKILSK